MIIFKYTLLFGGLLNFVPHCDNCCYFNTLVNKDIFKLGHAFYQSLLFDPGPLIMYIVKYLYVYIDNTR